MGNSVLNSVLIGQNIKIYSELIALLNDLNLDFKVRQVRSDKLAIKRVLRQFKGACLVFISDEAPFSVEQLSNLIWQHASDAIVVILTKKTQTTSLKTLFNNTQFAKINFEGKSNETRLFIRFLIEIATLKSDFRRCKGLLRVSEKKCQWLVDSSREAVAYISTDLHLYANTTYLKLFKIGSIQELHSITVRDLIKEDERSLFNSFQNNQIKHSSLKHSLIVTMKKKNGANFRASIHVFTTVYKSKKCLQLWVHDLSKESSNSNEKKLESIIGFVEKPNSLESTHHVAHPFDVLKADLPSTNRIIRDPALILKGIIKRKEATITVQRIARLKKDESHNKKYKSYYLLSLKVSNAQRKGIDDLLFTLSTSKSDDRRSVFWDKVKLTRLLQILLKKKQLNDNLFITISMASITDRSFIEWLLLGLHRVGNKASNVTFLLPTFIEENHREITVKFVQRLKSFDCQVAFDDFSVNAESISMLKQISPSFVRLSLSWVRQIEGYNSKEISLSSIIRKLETKGIKVITPCGFSADMKRLFVLSGASFCLDKK